jgi:hypothetical protein
MGSLRITALALAFALAATLAASAPRPLHAQDSTHSVTVRVREILAPIMVARQARDSLSALADTATGDRRTLLEERVWQQHAEVMVGIQSAAGELERIRKGGLADYVGTDGG